MSAAGSVSSLLEVLELETSVLTIAALDATHGKTLSPADGERVLAAKDRVNGIIEALREVMTP